MNWLDIGLLVWLGIGAFKGFRNGFIIELCALIGLLLGIWGAVHFSDRVSEWCGWGEDKTVIAFLVTMLLVMFLVHLGAKALTKAIDIAQLSLPNKVAGIVFGVVRMAFLASVLLNAVPVSSWGGSTPSKEVMQRSALYEPVRAFAPMLVPALGGTKWVKRTIERMKEEGGKLME